MAQVVSVLFFVISELAAIEPMYQYSLAWFVSLFEDTIAKADKARELSKRIENLGSHLQYSLYVQVSSGSDTCAVVALLGLYSGVG